MFMCITPLRIQSYLLRNFPPSLLVDIHKKPPYWSESFKVADDNGIKNLVFNTEAKLNFTSWKGHRPSANLRQERKTLTVLVGSF